MMEKLTRVVALAFCIGFPVCAAHAQVLRIVGPSTLVMPVKDAGEVLKKEQNLTLQVAGVISSNGEKIADIGENQADIAIVLRPLTAPDRAPYPDIDFHEIQFGAEGVAVAVAENIWNAGVRSPHKGAGPGNIRGENQKLEAKLGGPDQPITAYTPAEDRSVWSCYVQWLYDDPTAIPVNHSPETKTDDEARAFLESTPNAITQVSFVYAGANHLHVLAFKNDDGKLIEPSAATVADHSYPVARPLILVVKGRPLNDTATFVKFMLGDGGQNLVHKYNFLTLKELGITPPSI